MNYDLTQHARTVLAERRIATAWMERTLTSPALTEPDPDDPTLEFRFLKIPEFGDRVLRVVVNKQVAPVRVVSVYFDRSMKGRI